MKPENSPRENNRATLFLPLAMVGLSVLAASAAGASFLAGPRITASDGAPDDNFGYSLSLEADLVLVGAPGEDDAAASAGAVYVLARNQGGANTWGEVLKLTANDGTMDDLFGWSVSLNSFTAAIGAPQDDDGLGPLAGSAYIREQDHGGPGNWGEIKKIRASDGSALARFGWSIAISGDTVAVGAPDADSHGAVYIFERNCGGADNWGEVTKLTASDISMGDLFGFSISLDVDTLVVGAPFGDDHGYNSGSAYVFERNHGGVNNWEEVTKLTASNSTPGDEFGFAVSIDTDTIAVGAYASNVRASKAGAVFVFERNYGGLSSWGERAQVMASDGDTEDWFGRSLEIDNDLLVVGALQDEDNGSSSGSVYVFHRNEGGLGNWGEVDKLLAFDGIPSDLFSRALTISGSTIIVGAFSNVNPILGVGAGSIYLFEDDLIPRIMANFSASPVSGIAPLSVQFSDTSSAINTAITSWQWDFDNNGTVDSTAQNPSHLYATPGAYTVSLNVSDEESSDETVAVELIEVAAAPDSWEETTKILASDATAGDLFGYAVALDQDTAIVGAYGDAVAGLASGSAYIFERHYGGIDNWGEVAKLTASDAAAEDYFGISVAIDGNIAVVGAYQDDDSASNAGSAYIFERNPEGNGTWEQVAKLTASDAKTGNRFGQSVSVSGDIVAVGGANNDAVYVFDRDQGGANNWGEMKKLTASDGSKFDRFGLDVAIDGTTIVVGAYNHSASSTNRPGASYIFERHYGGTNNWGEIKKLTASDASTFDRFGWNVAISGNTVVIGADRNDDGFSDSGSAYIFERDHGGANNWGEVAKLTASDAASDDRFGYSVAINGDNVVVGAPWEDERGNSAGAAYLFHRNIGGVENWGELTKITANDGAKVDQFGGCAFIDGTTAIIGAHLNDDGGTNSGSAYIFEVQ